MIEEEQGVTPVRAAPWHPSPSTLQIAAHLLRFERPGVVCVGMRVRMSAEWRDKNLRPTVLRENESGLWFSENGPMWLRWEGRVLRIFERQANKCAMNCEKCAALPQTEDVAVVEHEPADCGCTPYRGRVCQRCEDTFIATRRFVRVEDLEEQC